jgi:hypothetical protein
LNIKEFKLPSTTNTTSKSDSGNLKLQLKSLLDFLKLLPFKELYQVAITFGGFWLFAFFVSIGRLPEFDITTAITLLLGIAFSGVFIVVLICAYFLMPSFFLHQIWSQLFNKNKSLSDSASEKKLRRLFLIFSFFCFLISLLLLLILIISKSDISFSAVLSSAITKAIATVLLALLVSLSLFDILKNKLNWINIITGNKLQFLWVAVQLTGLWFIAWLILFILFAHSLVYAFEKGEWVNFMVYIGFILNVFIFNSITITFKTLKEKVQSLAFISLVIIVLVSMVINVAKGISLIKAPFKMLNLGEISDASLIVKSEVCKQINFFEPRACTLINNEEYGILYNVKIANKIGNEFLISIPKSDFVSLKKQNLIAIKKEDVLTWNILTKEDSR